MRGSDFFSKIMHSRTAKRSKVGEARIAIIMGIPPGCQVQGALMRICCGAFLSDWGRSNHDDTMKVDMKRHTVMNEKAETNSGRDAPPE